ncbi:MAG: hypothetical protein ACOCR0_02970 [Haloferacaceae archaeon]
MTDTTPAFLTDQRRAVLAGEYDGEPNTERTHKSRIRSRAKTALQELIEVAESDAIDNADVFEPNDLARLIDALMHHADGLTPRWNYDGDPAEYNEKYQYQMLLHGRLNHQLSGYGTFLLQRNEPTEYPPNTNE